MRQSPLRSGKLVTAFLTTVSLVIFLASGGNLYGQVASLGPESNVDVTLKSGTPLTSRVNPGLRINSSCDETKPMFSPDGRKLYFARKRSPMNTGGVGDPQDIWVSTFDGRRWSAAQNAGRGFNTTAADNLCAVVNDSSFIFFIKDLPRSGYFELREFSKGKLTASSTIGPRVVSSSPYLEASFSSDLDVVVFTASNRSNIDPNAAEDERDIFVSVKSEHGWSKPTNLGANINTFRDEFSPFLAHDKKTLFFAAQRADTYGGADVYYATRLNGSWTSWSLPVNLGPRINSAAFDGYFTCNERGQAFMVTYSQTYGRGDIVAIPNPLKQQESIFEDNISPMVGLPSLYFVRGTSELTRESVQMIENVVNTLKSHPELKVEVMGHTDNEGTPKALLKLSRQRVSTIRKLLLANGVERKRIDGKACGSALPASSNQTEEGKKKNRRVELVVVPM